MFGEWYAARHSLNYDRLSDWFLPFYIYDRGVGKFLSIEQRNQLAQELNISTVSLLKHAITTRNQLIRLLDDTRSRYLSRKVEGIIIHCGSPLWCENREKLVNRKFVQALENYWHNRTIEWNLVNTKSVRCVP